MSAARSADFLTVPVAVPASRRRVRKCHDCAEPNPATAEHTDPHYCPACIGAHSTRCTSCTVMFTRDGEHTLCTSCRGQLPLFGDPA